MHLGGLVRVVLKSAGIILLVILRMTGILFRYGTSTAELDPSALQNRLPDVLHGGQIAMHHLVL